MWVLHAAYGWIVISLVLRGLAAIGVVAEVFAVRALTVGAIGGHDNRHDDAHYRGHTGRLLAVDGFDVACHVLVALAAAVRVFGGMLLPETYVTTVIVSGILWSAAFGLYAVHYWPVLSRPRLDSKPGQAAAFRGFFGATLNCERSFAGSAGIDRVWRERVEAGPLRRNDQPREDSYLPGNHCRPGCHHCGDGLQVHHCRIGGKG